MASNNYIGTSGLIIQNLEEIVEDLKEQYKAVYGQNINIEQNSPDGQLINIAAQAKMDILDLITQYYNNLDPDRAVGVPQQILYKLNGLTIKAYTYSYCYVDVVVTQSVTLQGLDENIESSEGTGYTVRDTNGNRWILTETQNLEPGTYSLIFRAANLGSITSSPNTITIMETVQRGIASVNNPAANYITGNQGETAAEFRLRRNKSMAVPSQGFDESIQSQMLNLTNVTQCKVYDNRNDTTQNGIPPHAVWVIVEGGTAEEIGNVIYHNIPPGIPMKGSIEVEVPRAISGELATVYYDSPTAIPLFIKATIKQFGVTSIDTDFVKSQLELLTYEIQEMATTATITTVMSNAVGDIGTPYNVEISQGGTATASVSGTGVTAATVDAHKFQAAMGVDISSNSYVFTYDTDNWEYNNTVVNLADYGIEVTGTPVDSDTVTIAFVSGSWGEYSTPSGLDQYFVIQASNIALTVDDNA